MATDLPYQRHSDTSRAAAESVAAHAPPMRRRVFDVLRAAAPFGLTDEEMQHALAMPPSTQRPRRIELVRSGLVTDSGDRRPTVSGHSATIWVWTGRAYRAAAKESK